ncbi:hypothetical protein DITRI_Ditri17bG0102400 [Diplodiscus trichospermus]
MSNRKESNLRSMTSKFSSAPGNASIKRKAAASSKSNDNDLLFAPMPPSSENNSCNPPSIPTQTDASTSIPSQDIIKEPEIVENVLPRTTVDC